MDRKPSSNDIYTLNKKFVNFVFTALIIRTVLKNEENILQDACNNNNDNKCIYY